MYIYLYVHGYDNILQTPGILLWDLHANSRHLQGYAQDDST
jgi:hypothetical protein